MYRVLRPVDAWPVIANGLKSLKMGQSGNCTSRIAC